MGISQVSNAVFTDYHAPNGTVRVYDTGTSNYSNLYKDSSGSTAESNPVTLDSRGQAVIFANTNKKYDITVFDEDGGQVSYIEGAILAGTDTGGTVVSGTPYKLAMFNADGDNIVDSPFGRNTGSNNTYVKCPIFAVREYSNDEEVQPIRLHGNDTSPYMRLTEYTGDTQTSNYAEYRKEVVILQTADGRVDLNDRGLNVVNNGNTAELKAFSTDSRVVLNPDGTDRYDWWASYADGRGIFSIDYDDGIIQNNFKIETGPTDPNVTIDGMPFKTRSDVHVIHEGQVECQGSFKLPVYTSDPVTATNGMQYYNTTTNKFRGYANGAWVDLH